MSKCTSLGVCQYAKGNRTNVRERLRERGRGEREGGREREERGTEENKRENICNGIGLKMSSNAAF